MNECNPAGRGSWGRQEDSWGILVTSSSLASMKNLTSPKIEWEVIKETWNILLLSMHTSQHTCTYTPTNYTDILPTSITHTHTHSYRHTHQVKFKDNGDEYEVNPFLIGYLRTQCKRESDIHEKNQGFWEHWSFLNKVSNLYRLFIIVRE